MRRGRSLLGGVRDRPMDWIRVSPRYGRDRNPRDVAERAPMAANRASPVALPDP